MTNPIDERFFNHLSEELSVLTDVASKIAGEWDGDNSGLLEDRASCAGEIIETANKLDELLHEIQELGIDNDN